MTVSILSALALGALAGLVWLKRRGNRWDSPVTGPSALVWGLPETDAAMEDHRQALVDALWGDINAVEPITENAQRMAALDLLRVWFMEYPLPAGTTDEEVLPRIREVLWDEEFDAAWDRFSVALDDAWLAVRS